MRLWIIGNGFDLYHGLQTRYADYKAYLCQRHTCKRKNCEKRPNELPREVCRNCCEGKNKNSGCPVMKFNLLPRRELKEDLWRDLEESCSIDLDALLRRLDGYHEDANDELGESVAEKLLHKDLDFAKDFTATWFSRWLEEVESELSKKSKNDQLIDIDASDVFLTFNYTTTLQKIYGIPTDHIAYLHGCMTQVGEKNSERKKLGVLKNDEGKIVDEGDIGRMFLVFGSTDLTNSAINAAVDRYAEAQELDDKRRESLRHHLFLLSGSMKKDVRSRLNFVRSFVGKYCGELLSLEEVVVAGHSLGRIDAPYFDYLADYLGGVKWKFIFHSESDLKNAVEFCKKYNLNGYYMPWNTARKACFAGVQCCISSGIPCPCPNNCVTNGHR